MTDVDTDKWTVERKYHLGERLIMPDRRVFRYGKVDVGSLGKIDGKRVREVYYCWIPWRL